MKLLQINVTCNQGSTGGIAEQVGLLMKEYGWDVYLCHGARYVEPSQLKTYLIGNKCGEYLHALKSLLFDADGFGSTRATMKLVEYIKQVKPNLIQIHNLHGYYVNYKILFKYLNTTSIPIVMTLHDCWVFTGHCIHFVTVDCEKWKSGCGKCPQICSVPKSLVFDRSKRNFEQKKKYIAGNRNLHLVCVSKWIEDFLHQSMYKEHPIHLIRNGIDLSVYRPTVEKKKDKFRILGVSNPWSRDKGLYDIYELRNMLPLDEYDITLVGLKKLQKEVLPKGINGILRTNNKLELVDLYSASDVFINLTYADTYPTTNLEALACGTPVITYRTGGSPESLSEDTGIVIEQGDVKALAEAIKKMRVNPFASNTCRKRATELFDKNELFMDYVKLYEKLVR